MTFRKGKWGLKRTDGRYDRFVTCLFRWSADFSPVVRVVVELEGRRFMIVEFFLELLLLGR